MFQIIDGSMSVSQDQDGGGGWNFEVFELTKVEISRFNCTDSLQHSGFKLWT